MHIVATTNENGQQGRIRKIEKRQDLHVGSSTAVKYSKKGPLLLGNVFIEIMDAQNISNLKLQNFNEQLSTADLFIFVAADRLM